MSRRVAILAAVTGVALLAAACGGSSTTSANALLKFAECMRSHGITNFPDPFENSHQVGFNTAGLDSTSPRFKAAMTACRPLLPGGGP